MMELDYIVGRKGKHVSEDGVTQDHRLFGDTGGIATLPLESGEVLVAIGGHDALLPPEDDWTQEARQTYERPLYCVIAEPVDVPKRIDEAHNAADMALKAEATAVQAAKPRS